MKIAVTYQNGMVFQHFGKSEAFKYYEADEWGDIVAAEVKSTNGQGHCALAQFLSDNGVDVLRA